ncbi:MAG TPA: enoyl-CoA hydratase/isomerase family protein [Geobacteraceae bacterium]
MDFLTIFASVRDDGIGLITLNRPEKRNALSIRMRQEISTCLHGWLMDDNVGLVVITGAGNAFCSGFDLEEFRQQDLFYQILESSSSYHRDLWTFPKPTIAAINGAAIGGGFDLATLCDIRICADTALFAHPEVKFGAPPLFTPLRWIIGDGMARDLCMTGRRIDAREAHRIGLVSTVAGEDILLERAVQLGASILEAPLDTLRFAKGFFTENAGKGFEESFLREHDRAFREVLFRKMTPG